MKPVDMKAFAASVMLCFFFFTGYVQQIYQNNVPDYLKKIDTPRVYHNTIKLPPIAKYTKDNLNNDTSGFAKSPLMILKENSSGKMVKLFPSLGYIKQDEIASLEILPDKKADSLFGPAAKYGVILTGLIASAKTYTMQQYLEHFKISKKDRQLPVYMDYNLLSKTNGMLFTIGYTKTVTVEKNTAGKRFINILTTEYPNLRVHMRNDKAEHEEWGKGMPK